MEVDVDHLAPLLDRVLPQDAVRPGDAGAGDQDVDPAQPVEELSGGNQQKVVIGKWLAVQPKVIILDEPTKGIDVGAKAAVHDFMVELAEQGLAVIMVSSELPEILGMADRIVVMHEGHVRRVFTREEASPEAVVTAATGAAPAGPAHHRAA